MQKSYSSFYYLTFLIFYFELISKILITKSFNGLIYTIIFTLPFIFLIYLICNLFKEKGNKILTFLITIIFTFYYSFSVIFYRLFTNIFSFNTIGLAKNIGEFKNMIFDSIGSNIMVILLFLLPLILLITNRKKINFKRPHFVHILLCLFFSISFYFLSLISLNFNQKNIYSAYNLYYNVGSEIKLVEKFGILTYTRLDIKRIIFGFEEKLITSPEIPEDLKPEEEKKETPVTYNALEINFDDLIASASNNTIKDTLTYFQNTSTTNKNAYTGMFKDKNLIFILAEGFNSIAVDSELTPTLYKLTHEGFVFNNFYSPVFLSTTGGEFQATTGLIPTQSTLANWKKLTPTISYALGNSLSSLGYYASSYHDWTYTYYNRNKTMPTLGFNSYLGCGNGLEKSMSCRWLPSDIDLINTTFPLYKDNDKFVTYYVTVSGHAPYAYKSTGNSIALKNTKYVENLPYSNNVKAYLATQIELDRALETLIDLLKEENILDDTVIALVGDHYPYTLTTKEINEVSTYERDSIIEVNHSNFILWNNTIKEPIIIDKVGSEIDVLPTLLNLFAIDYDSRLIMGKDILSDEPGLAIFSDRSWVSDYGTYKNNHLTLKDNVTLDNQAEYINYINNLVNARFTISNNIIKYKLYDYILK